MKGYTVKVKEASKELSKKELVMLKDTSDAAKLDEVIQGEALIIDPAFYAVLDIHNEKSDNKDYEVYIIVDKDGSKYITGSESFYTSFTDIWEEMNDGEVTEEWKLKCYKLDSKNFKGKQFLTCSIL